MKLVCSVLFVLLILPMCRSSPLQDTCRSFAAGHPSIGYDYCIRIFQADKSSAEATDARGLAAIAARIAEAKANATAARIASMSALERDARRRDRLSVCAEVYSDAVDQLDQAEEELAHGAKGRGAAASMTRSRSSARRWTRPRRARTRSARPTTRRRWPAEDTEFKNPGRPVALAIAASLAPPPSMPRPKISD
uniref:Invertase inhibitor n=1 Tax=Saccharum robustum TaxID=62334 RepID=A0A0B4U8W3_SACRO|nr:invertase inhibitor [Saccharum robustum]